jgi:hypothetical protein
MTERRDTMSVPVQPEVDTDGAPDTMSVPSDEPGETSDTMSPPTDEPVDPAPPRTISVPAEAPVEP